MKFKVGRRSVRWVGRDLACPCPARTRTRIEAGKIDSRACENVGRAPRRHPFLPCPVVRPPRWTSPPSRSRGCERPWKNLERREGGELERTTARKVEGKAAKREGGREEERKERGGRGRKQRVIDFCRGFARRYPLYPRLCGPVCRGTPGWFARRRRASRRRPPIGGSRPQGAALITRPCNTVSLSAALASKPLYRASLPPIYIPADRCTTTNTRH